MLTTAQQIDILFQGRTYDADLDADILDFAKSLDPAGEDQDWENETTTYTFCDGSKLIVGDTGYEVD